MTAIEEFAKEQMDITLTSGQLNYIRAFTEGRQVTVQFIRQAGVSTANKVIREYLKAGLK